MTLNEIVRGRLPGGGYRFAFLHPFSKDFHHACRALEVRELLSFGPQPIAVPGLTYNAWFADIKVTDAQAYAAYAMLVRDFFNPVQRRAFDEVFFGLDLQAVTPVVNNPARYLKAQAAEVQRLVDKYKDTATPLTYYNTNFSAEGVALFLDSLKAKDGRRGAINNYSQGMGKTRIGCISTIEAGFKRVLVVVPKTARVTAWPAELSRLGYADEFFMLNSKNWETSTKRWDLLQWDELRRMPDLFFARSSYELLLADEYHLASNMESQRSAAMESLMSRIPWLWGMSGTTVRKRPSNLVNLLILIRHPFVCTAGRRDDDKVTRFLARYCGEWDAKQQKWNLKKPQNLGELHALLRDSMIRHEKEETSLPPQITVPTEVFFSEKEIEAMEQAWEDFKAEPVNKAKMQHAPDYPYAEVRQGVLQRAAAVLMTPYTIAWAEDLVKQGRKAILFTASTEVFDIFKKHFGPRGVGIDGRTPTTKRTEAEQRFQTDPTIDVFYGNIVAAGVSLTLTATPYLAFNDINWVTTDVEQAAERNWRGGTTETCWKYLFYAKDTPLETMYKDYVKNLAVVDQVSRLRDAQGNLIKKSDWRPQTLRGEL